MSIDADIRLAVNEVKVAENRFDNAIGKDVDFAITQLLEAEEKLNDLIKKKKEGIRKDE